MKIFVDTNILLDILIPRKDRSYTENSAVFLELRNKTGYELCVSTISMATCSYFLKDREDSVKRLRLLTKNLTILDTLASDFLTALKAKQPDIEDAMQLSVAASNHCDLIVTRDKTGFANSPVPYMTPESVLSIVQ